MTTLKIEFDNPEAANHFARWLCGAGEQDYWEWMRCREERNDGPITATEFHYNDVADNVIRTTCGRLDER